MTKDGGSSDASAARAFTLALGLSKAKSSPRIAALASDGGKSCLFRSIVDTRGQPVAEVAVLHELDRGRVQDEPGLLGKLSREEDVAPLAAMFRERAVREFGLAPGLPRERLLYLPWYCCVASVDAVGPSLPMLLERAPLPAVRIVVELQCPDGVDALALLGKRGAWLRSLGLSLSLRIGQLGDLARRAVTELAPDWLLLSTLPRFEQAASIGALVELGTQSDGARPRCVLGGVDTPEDASLADGLGVEFLCGDSVAEARFLC